MSLPADPLKVTSALYTSLSTSIEPLHSALEDLTHQLCRRIEQDRRSEAHKYELLRSQFHNLSERHFSFCAAHERFKSAAEEESRALTNEACTLREDSERLGRLCEELKEEVRALREENEKLNRGEGQHQANLSFAGEAPDASQSSEIDLTHRVIQLQSERHRWKTAYDQLKTENDVNDMQWKSLVGSLRASLDRSKKEITRLKAEVESNETKEEVKEEATKVEDSIAGPSTSQVACPGIPYDSDAVKKEEEADTKPSVNDNSRQSCISPIKREFKSLPGFAPAGTAGLGTVSSKRPPPPKLTIITTTTSNAKKRRRV